MQEEEFNTTPTEEKIATEVLKGYNFKLIKDGLFIPDWFVRGGRSQKLLVEMQNPIDTCIYHKVFTKDIDFSYVRRKTRGTLKFPLYLVITKVDNYLLEMHKKISGLADVVPEKKFLKEYVIAIDPLDSMGLWEGFADFKNLTTEGKKLYTHLQVY
jgi:hypothetical protein